MQIEKRANFFSLLKAKKASIPVLHFSLDVHMKEKLGLTLSPKCLYLTGKHIPALLHTLKK